MSYVHILTEVQAKIEVVLETQLTRRASAFGEDSHVAHGTDEVTGLTGPTVPPEVIPEVPVPSEEVWVDALAEEAPHETGDEDTPALGYDH